MQLTIFKRSAGVVAASRQRCTAQLPNLFVRVSFHADRWERRDRPVRHHLEAARADGVNDLPAVLGVGDLELLLEEDGRLLVARTDDARYEEVVRRRRRGVK
jgi:hypothetical protein